MNNRRIAEDFNGFVETVSEAIRKKLNSEIGQELTEQLLRAKLKENPNMTAAEWKETKSEFMTFLFAMFVKEMPQAMNELGHHIWNELQKD